MAQTLGTFFTEASGVGQKEDWFVSTTAASQMELTSNELSICLTNTGMLGGQKASCGKAAICWASTAIFKAAHLARFSEHMRFAALSEAFKGKSKSFKFSATKKKWWFSNSLIQKQKKTYVKLYKLVIHLPTDLLMCSIT